MRDIQDPPEVVVVRAGVGTEAGFAGLNADQVAHMVAGWAAARDLVRYVEAEGTSTVLVPEVGV